MFTITQPIRRTGLDRVYGAKDSLGRDIFLKVCSDNLPGRMGESTIPQDMSAEEDGPPRHVGFVFEEANCLSSTDHPNIIAFHRAFEVGDDADQNSAPVVGPSMRDVIADPDRRLQPKQIVSVARILLDALRSIHAQGLLHGDVSVDNILLNERNEPFLVDFGAVRCVCNLSQEVTDEPQDESLTEGCTHDTPCGPWRDLRGLAAALHHAIAGQPLPLAGTEASASATPGPAPKLADRVKGYPRGFLESIDTALEAPPAATFQSADEWLAVLKEQPRQKESNMKLLEKALGLGRPKRTSRPQQPKAADVEDNALSSDADADLTVGAEDHPDVGADQPQTVGTDAVSPPLPPLKLVNEGNQMAIDLSGLREINGFIAGCLVDCESGLMLASELAGKFDIETAAAANVDVVRGKQTAIRLLGLNDTIEDILITLSSQFHLIRPLEGAPNLFLYAALDRKVANLGMARLQVKKVEQSIQF